MMLSHHGALDKLKLFHLEDGGFYHPRDYKSTLSSVIPKLPAATSELSGQFVELSINEPEQLLNLQEVTLKFSNLSISMQGQIKSSVLISVVKTLEEVC